MALLGLRVVATNGQPLSMRSALLRAALVWSEVGAVGALPGATDAAAFAVALVGLIAPMKLRQDRRGLHDLVADCVVVVP
jgi:uncharacterized RDD family membrane protein YckC